jgi:hypothetical protein
MMWIPAHVFCYTDSAKDTSDTTTHSDCSNEVTMDVEYEVASLSEQENPIGDDSFSSDTDVSCTKFLEKQ